MIKGMDYLCLQPTRNQVGIQLLTLGAFDRPAGDWVSKPASRDEV